MKGAKNKNGGIKYITRNKFAEAALFNGMFKL
jgi:hypothetical protein